MPEHGPQYRSSDVDMADDGETHNNAATLAILLGYWERTKKNKK